MALITPHQAQIISTSERPAGRQKLLEALEWEPFDEENDRQKAILLDYHYDNLIYCVQKGLPWQHVCTSVAMAADVLDSCKGKTLPEAVKIYQEQCQKHCTQIGEHSLKTFTDYFFETFMKHYSLYQFVFGKVQDNLTVDTEVTVNTPPEPLPFTDSKPVNLWDYQQKFKEVETTEENRQNERVLERMDQETTLAESLDSTVQCLQTTESPIERERLIEIINDVATAHVTSATYTIKSNISDTMEDVGFMLEKTIIPRPQELGPPPRYKTRTPLAAPKRPKSTKEKTPPRDKSAKSQAGGRATSKTGQPK